NKPARHLPPPAFGLLLRRYKRPNLELKDERVLPPPFATTPADAAGGCSCLSHRFTGWAAAAIQSGMHFRPSKKRPGAPPSTPGPPRSATAGSAKVTSGSRFAGDSAGSPAPRSGSYPHHPGLLVIHVCEIWA